MLSILSASVGLAWAVLKAFCVVLPAKVSTQTLLPALLSRDLFALLLGLSIFETILRRSEKMVFDLAFWLCLRPPPNTKKNTYLFSGDYGGFWCFATKRSLPSVSFEAAERSRPGRDRLSVVKTPCP